MTPDTKADQRSFWMHVPEKELKHWVRDVDLKFHTSWAWLMPVLIEIGNRTGHWVVLGPGYTYIHHEDEEEYPFDISYGYDSIDQVHTYVAEFIQWYNNKKEKA